MGTVSDTVAQPAEAGAGFPEGEWADRVDAAAAKILYDQKSGDSLLKGISGGDGPNAVAQTTSTLIVNIDDKLGGKVPEEDILPAAVKVLERVIELREKATGAEMPDEEIKQALGQMMKMLAKEYGTTSDQAQGFVGEFDESEVTDANQMFGGG